MFKDVINLISTSEVSDGAGGYENAIATDRQVFALKKSVKQNEFYLAAQSDLQVETVFRLNLLDYQNEVAVKHNNDYYSVIRSYEMGDYIELTCQKRLGGLDEVLNS